MKNYLRGHLTEKLFLICNSSDQKKSFTLYCESLEQSLIFALIFARLILYCID
ncbi:hypothetical protein DB41_HS00070 [Neochlamydia sp. TUME1]|nr:hypothetical protein DB41_HS00070 [Neochlamydia sp. TUME1]